MVIVAKKRNKLNKEALEEHKEVLKLRQSSDIKGKTVAEIRAIVHKNIKKRTREK